ncbi:hypothetical protein JTE90_009374 [Oedothorax gibbosus]|uniref:Lipocalin/cytosolic fatty-acid binding domain-containing protein n=1 Tax=Oedothorax gibbosus TaxID=931172 RepID=A0AAV6VUS9_9ARAC|nr:hypothetical protein JTE90_009374 [Oedothorax gibbosus]
MIFVLLLFSIPLVLGQLILGPCPYPPEFVRNLDYEKYSGPWYVVAQSRQHPMNALECQRVHYTSNDKGLNAVFNTSKAYSQQQKHKNGTLIREYNKSPGELKLALDTFSRFYQFRVLSVNYSQVAVEYTCLSGVFNYTASVTILHRQPAQLGSVNSALSTLNLTNVIPHKLRSSIVLVNHTNCNN